MTFYAKNGSGDEWYYGRWEDEATYERYIALLGGSEDGRYGRYCGWMEAFENSVIDNNTTLITNELLDTIEASGDVENELDKLEEMDSGAFWDNDLD